MITCKLTGNNGVPIKAHIVPRAFYEVPPQKDGALSLISNAAEAFPKKSPVGIYDASIVTIEGENIFDPLDDYASRLLLDGQSSFKEIRDKGKLCAWSLSSYNYLMLKLFALSVLWRADVSSHAAFSKVILGSHEAVIRKMLLNDQPGLAEQYSVIISKWTENEFGPVFMDPFCEKYDGINYYRIYCGRYLLYVKVDKKKTKGSFSEAQLRPESGLVIVARELKRSKEWPVMKKIAMENAHLQGDYVSRFIDV